MTHGSLFSGIGGFDLAAEWMGWENKFHCEWNEFGQKVLNYYWPDAESFGDITKTDFKKYNGTIDIISGGFPCQPYSGAGKRLGKADDRHLWPEMLRAIGEVQPSWVVGENVRGLTNWNGGMVFDEVQADLETKGYQVLPFLLPACAVNAPHRRDRIWFIAYSGSNVHKGRLVNRRDKSETGRSENKNEQSDGWDENRKRIWAESGTSGKNATDAEGVRIDRTTQYENGNRQSGERRGYHADDISEIQGRRTVGAISDPQQPGLEGGGRKRKGLESGCEINGDPRIKGIEFDTFGSFPTQSPLCSRNDGLSPELAGITFSKHRNESIKGYGNAIVPQVAYQIFKTIEQYEQLINTQK